MLVHRRSGAPFRPRAHVLAVVAALVVLAAGCSSGGTVADSDVVDLEAVAAAPAGEATDEPDGDDSTDPEESGSVTSRDNPVPLGETGRVLFDRPVLPIDWGVTVVGVTENADVDIDVPIEGRVPVLIDLEVTNNSDRREVISSLSTGVADDATEYTGFDECGPNIPNSIPMNPLNIEPGETVQRAVCFQVDPSELATLLMSADPSGLTDMRVWFALR